MELVSPEVVQALRARIARLSKCEYLLKHAILEAEEQGDLRRAARLAGLLDDVLGDNPQEGTWRSS